jgi:uncharacterized heparinase superfamily protein
MRLIFDTGRLGPDYLPGHAHNDMLAILLDFEGRQIFTDTGVYEYAEGNCRLYCRSTAAHNTVSIDNLEQSEIWKSFRMGRRGHPNACRQDDTSLSCSHTGFSLWQPGLGHERTISFLENGFELTDRLSGAGRQTFKAYYHSAPEVRIQLDKDGSFMINDRLKCQVWGAAAHLASSDYYPEFGISRQRPCLILQGNFSGQYRFGMRCTYYS